MLLAVTAHVDWAAAVPLGAGTAIGGLAGPSVARRARPGILRVVIACAGFVLAAWLLISP